MGLKKLFNTKPPEEETIEENRINLNSMGIPVKMTNRIRRSKFDAFNAHSKEKSQGIKTFAPAQPKARPISPVSPELTNSTNNPYANFNFNDGGATSSPFQANGSSGTQTSSPYTDSGNHFDQVASPYNGATSSPYGALSSPTYGQSNNHMSHGRSMSPSYNSPGNARVNSPQYGRTTSTSYSRNSSHSYGQLRSPTSSTSHTDNLYPETSLTGQDWSPPITPLTRHTSSFSDSHDHNAPSMSNNTLLNPYKSRRSTLTSNRSLSRQVSLNREDPALKSAKASLFETHSQSPDPYAAYDDVQSGMDNLTINPAVPLQEQEQERAQVDEEEDLNAIPEYAASVNLNEEPLLETNTYHPDRSADAYSYQAHSYDFEGERQRQLEQEQAEEDEEVDRIKQDIKFTKQQSVASTRNTVRMASEAEASGANTLGMLGAQSEKLYGIERDLLLAKTQNVVATDKVKEMAKLDRSFLLVHVTNPFNSRRRMQRQEGKIRNQRTEDNIIQNRLRAQQYNTEANLIAGLEEADREEHRLPVNAKYDRARRLEKASKYQYEQDEEDDDMEVEISKNLDAIETSTQKLHGMARAIGQEVDTQQKRWRQVEDDTDKLELEIHLNNHRLAGVMK